MSVKLHIPSKINKKASMHYFSSETCGHCKKFNPVFASFMDTSLPGQGVEFVCIDVTPKMDGGNAAKKAGVSVFPTLRLSMGGQTMTYPTDAPRDQASLEKWLRAALRKLQESGTYQTWDRNAATQRAGDPYMDRMDNMYGDDRASTSVPARFVYGRNNTNVKYRKYENTPFQDHRNRLRRDASKLNLSFAAADHNDDAAIRDSYPSTYEMGQDANVGADTSLYATINMGTTGDIGY